MERKNAWKTYSEEDISKLNAISAEYVKFLDNGKTERECVAQTVEMAKAKGYRNLNTVIANGEKLNPGDCVYSDFMGKALMLFKIGKQPIFKGLNIVGAHIDSPRIDLKQNPLYEDTDFAYLDTHYYGGIKKYQWVAMPLAMHGVVAKKDGTLVNIVIGEDPSDPVIGISDLLPHLSRDQMSKKGSVVIEGEELNIIIGSKPLNDEEKEPVKAAVLALLKEKYDIEEEDFLSAELEVVPAGAARDFGLDRSMILGYGHDDRVCAYASVNAILSIDETPEYTCCCLLADKEEIGSVGVSGMQSYCFETFVRDLCDSQGASLDRCFENAFCLSADVTNAFDPNFAETCDKRNNSRLNYGVGICKYTGSRGKGGASDASAEAMGYVRTLFENAGVVWQTATLGKVDQGGGGTVAAYMANRNIVTVDAGVPVLCMHAPWELVSKFDTYMTMKAMTAVYAGK
mgnify:CR=1 FL=1